MSTIKVNTLEEATTGGATFFTSKAWVNFNGVGTVAIRQDGNVSSITDNGVGSYTVNFTSNLTDANYAMTASASRYSVANSYGGMNVLLARNHDSGSGTAPTSSACALNVRSGSSHVTAGNLKDTYDVMCSFAR
jgi:hypothetical protein